MTITKKQRNNLFFLIVIAVLLIPQTRQPIQVLLHKGLALFSPSTLDKEDQLTLTNYDWILIDENGKKFDLNDAKGRVVIVNFWATWCPPCIAEMPNLEKLYQDYKENVVFLLVSDESEQVISKFKSTNDYDFLVYSSISANPKLLEAFSIPRTFVIDKQGNIVIDKTGAADWNSKSVRKLLDDLLASN